MKSFLSQLKNDLTRAGISKFAILAVIMWCTLLFIFNVNEIIYRTETSCVMYLINNSMAQSLGDLLYVFSVFPCIIIFTEDIKSNSITYMISRIGRIKYYSSKAIAVFISSYLIVAMSIVAFVILNLPFIKFIDESYLSQLYFVTKSYDPYFSLFFIITIKGLFSSSLAVLCLLISIKFNNIFLLLSMPFIITKFYYNLSGLFEFPQILSFYNLSKGNLSMSWIKSSEQNLAVISLIFISLSLILALIFILKNRKHEL